MTAPGATALADRTGRARWPSTLAERIWSDGTWPSTLAEHADLAHAENTNHADEKHSEWPRAAEAKLAG